MAAFLIVVSPFLKILEIIIFSVQVTEKAQFTIKFHSFAFHSHFMNSFQSTVSTEILYQIAFNQFT